jgi:hypothetical protein
MILHQALKKTSRVSTNTNSPNHQRFSVTIPATSVRTLQDSIDDRFINEGETVTVQCPIAGCNGLQPLKISIEKLPPILVLEIAATVDGRDETLLSCIEDIESKLTIQGTLYALVQVILHNGSHYRGVTVLNNQNVLYDGKFCNEFRSIGGTENFSPAGMDESYRVSCLWYRKVLNKYVLPLPQYSLPVYPPFAERSPEHNRSMEDDKILNEEKEYGANKRPYPETAAGDKTPKNDKRTSKPKKRYTPPDQSTPKPPKRRSKNQNSEK